MKKRWIIIIFILFVVLSLPAKAENMLVVPVNDFSSKNSPAEYAVVLSEAVHLKQGCLIEKGSIVKGKIVNVIEPKRLKKDAYFVFVADYYTVPSDDNKIVEIKNKTKSKIRYYENPQKLDAKELLGKAGIGVAGLFVKGLGMGINFVAGVAKPQEDENRVHSGFRHVVESWPFSYCLKGNDIEIKSGSIAIFEFNKKMFEQ